MAIHLAPSGRTYTIPEEVAAEIVGLKKQVEALKAQLPPPPGKGGK